MLQGQKYIRHVSLLPLISKLHSVFSLPSFHLLIFHNVKLFNFKITKVTLICVDYQKEQI